MTRPPTINPKAIESILLVVSSLAFAYGANVAADPLLWLAVLALAILAIVRGSMARRDIDRSGGQLGGRRLAGWGMALGLMWLGLLVLVGLMPAGSTPHVGARRAQAVNNLKQIGLAFHNYHSDYDRFPPAVVYGRDGRPLYSWRVVILPYLEQQALYASFHLDEPWDSPHNRQLLGKRPSIFAPVGLTGDPSRTYAQVFTGPGTAFEDRDGATLESFTDGPANTLLVVEAAEPVLWTRPIDLSYSPRAPLPPLGRPFVDGGKPLGFVGLFADGSVRFLKKRTTETILRALITRNGGEVVPPSAY